MKSTPKCHKSNRKDRFNYIIHDKQRLAIPIGPRFQADVPEWTGPPHKNSPFGDLDESDSSKWLGTMVWSMNDMNKEIEGDAIGKGKPESCNCSTQGSVECVKRHVAEKTRCLQCILGPAFKEWMFDQMGDGVAKLWMQCEQQRLSNLIRTSLFSNQDFIKPALECIPLKSKKDIVNFYFNVYIPRQMSIKTRSGCMMVDTDEEEEEESNNPFKGSRKKARINGVTVCNSKLVKARYMTQRR